jgi:3-methyladenine DNA glycosylase AlkC
MAELLKNIYSKDFFIDLILKFNTIDYHIDQKNFLNKIFDKEWDNRELKSRMGHIAIVLHDFLPKEFKDAVDVLLNLSLEVQKGVKDMGFEYMFLPDYIEKYGIDDEETSIYAMENITQLSSCEFAIRPFIINNESKMMKQMLKWSKHKNYKVRRLSSEGCRSRLPWAMALPNFKKDATLILPILENLKSDEYEFVQKSVANNLNDMSKDHPDLVYNICKKWQGKLTSTDWIVKHACRTILKAGNQKAMSLFGYGDTKKVVIENFDIHTKEIKIGDRLDFSFDIKNTDNMQAILRLEYTIYYQKANGSLTPKVYKISEKKYEPNILIKTNKYQSFKPISTRVFHKGLHQLAIIVNGVEFKRLDFTLI